MGKLFLRVSTRTWAVSFSGVSTELSVTSLPVAALPVAALPVVLGGAALVLTWTSQYSLPESLLFFLEPFIWTLKYSLCPRPPPFLCGLTRSQSPSWTSTLKYWGSFFWEIFRTAMNPLSDLNWSYGVAYVEDLLETAVSVGFV